MTSNSDKKKQPKRDNPDYPHGHCFTITVCEKCGEYYEAALLHICRQKNSYPKSMFK